MTKAQKRQKVRDAYSMVEDMVYGHGYDAESRRMQPVFRGMVAKDVRRCSQTGTYKSA